MVSIVETTVDVPALIAGLLTQSKKVVRSGVAIAAMALMISECLSGRLAFLSQICPTARF